MKLKTILACSIVFAWGNASADWQYTKWDMNRDQVEAAVAKAGVPLLPPFQPVSQQQGSGPLFEFRTTYEAGGVPFSAMFGFDRVSSQLTEVSLVPSIKGNCGRIRTALLESYGKPESVNDQALGRLVKTSDDLWRDANGKNLLTLNTYVAMGQQGCSVSYRPLTAASKSGF